MSEYKIGKYIYESEQDYIRAKKDVEHILKIKQNFNLKDPIVIGKIIEAVDSGKITFSSDIGKDFITALRRLRGEERQEKESKPISNKVFSKKRLGIIFVVVVILVVIAILPFWRNSLMNPLEFEYEIVGGNCYISGILLDEDEEKAKIEMEKITEIVFPARIDGYNVYSIAGYYEDYKNLKRVVISDGIQDINEGAFAYCESLEEVEIPDSVQSIGGMAFIRTNIKSIVIPEGVKEINKRTFRECKSLTNIVIPDSVMIIHDFAFADCPNLSEIELPKELLCLNDGVFMNCTSLKRIEIPSNVIQLGIGVFNQCTELTEVIFKSATTQFPLTRWGYFQECNPQNMTIYSPANTYAEDAAKVQGIKFVETILITPTVVPTIIPTQQWLDDSVQDISGGKVKLVDYHNMVLTAIEQEIVEEEIAMILESYLEYIEVDRRAEFGDIVNINYRGEMQGYPFEGGDDLSESGTDLELGSGMFIDGFEEELLGVIAGETRIVKVTFPEDYHNADYAGQDAIFTVEVNKVYETRIPNLTDEFVKETFGAASVEDYKKDFYDLRNKEYLSHQIIDIVMNGSEVVSYPDVMVTEKKEGIIDSYISMGEFYASCWGMDMMEVVTQILGFDSMDELEMFAEETALDFVKKVLIISAIAVNEEITLTEREYLERIGALAEENGYLDVEEFEDAYGKGEIQNLLLEEKVLEFLMKSATIVKN